MSVTYSVRYVRFYRTGEKACLCLPHKICRRTAGPGTSVNQHLPTGFEGRHLQCLCLLVLFDINFKSLDVDSDLSPMYLSTIRRLSSQEDE